MVDYSKWDKLELSDDSDIEVHPNVDKQSFIRWKQRDIHEKRQRNKFRTAQLECNVETNTDLLTAIDKILKEAASGTKIGFDVPATVKLGVEALNGKDKPKLATSPEQPKYGDMLESMMLQVVNEAKGEAAIVEKIKEHRKMITSALEDENKELAQLAEERAQHIVSDDIKTGWDSSFVNKKSESSEAAPASASAATPSKAAPTTSAATSKETHIETLNSPKADIPKPTINEEGMEDLLPATEKFGETPRGDLEAAYRFLAQHAYIVTEGQKDALIMTAFNEELAGNSTAAQRIVFNSLLIQYAAMLGGGEGGVRTFISKLGDKNSVAWRAFEEDVNKTYSHIQSRCKILAEQEETGDGEEVVQLHSVDPETELTIAVPDPSSEGYSIYEGFSDDVKKAVQTRSLDEINSVLASMALADAEDLVGKLGESGVLQVDDKIYEPEEWEKKQQELAGESEVS